MLAFRFFNYFIVFLILGSANLHAAILNFIPMTVLEISSSGLSFVSDKGQLDNLPENAKGYFVTFEADKKIFFVGSAKMIEIGNEQSYWYFDQIVEAKFLKQNAVLYFVDHRDLWDGRAPVRGLHTEQFVRDPKLIVKKIQLDGADFIAHQDQNFETERMKAQTIETTRQKNYQNAVDQELFGVADQKGVYRIEPTSNPRMDNFRTETEEEITKATLLGSLEKNNSPEMQEEMQVEIRMSQDLMSDNSLANMITEKRKERFLDNNALKKIKKDGAFWSADMSDQQLRRFFVTSGILQERDRRRYAIHHSAGNEISFSLQAGVKTNFTTSDVRNQIQPLGFMIGYEYQLGRTVEALSPFAAQFYWQIGVSGYNDGTVNLHSNESSFGFMINSYFFNHPNTIANYLPYLGVGLKRGVASLSSEEYASDIRYSLDISPVVKLGLKYRFSAADEYKKYLRMGGGISVEFLYEWVQLGFSDEETFGAPSSIDAKNMSILFGGNIYF